MLIATGYGILALACVLIIRRYALGIFGITAIAAPALGAAILLLAYHPAERSTSVLLAFAGASSPSLFALSERVLDDAPLVGTGAGTFAALAPIYRETESPNSVAATAAAAFAIELGKPMFWLIGGRRAYLYPVESLVAARARLVLSSNGRELPYHPPAPVLQQCRLRNS